MATRIKKMKSMKNKNCFMSIMNDRCLWNSTENKFFICVYSLCMSVLNKKKALKWKQTEKNMW